MKRKGHARDTVISIYREYPKKSTFLTGQIIGFKFVGKIVQGVNDVLINFVLDSGQGYDYVFTGYIVSYNIDTGIYECQISGELLAREQ